MTKTLKIVDGDISRSYTNTSYDYVEDKEKCRQDVQMILSTASRTSTGLGADLDSIIGQDSMYPISSFSPTPIMFEFQSRVKNGISRLMSYQKQYQYSERTSGELIYDQTPTEIWIVADDPRDFRWRVGIRTYSGANITINGGATR